MSGPTESAQPGPTESAQPIWPALGAGGPPADPGVPLRLRPWGEADVDALVNAWRDVAIQAWLDPPGTDAATAARWIEGVDDRRSRGVALDLAVIVEGAVAGEVGFSSFDPVRRACLVGYWVGSDHRGSGLGSRAVAAACDWLVGSCGPISIVAECALTNVASHRTAERAGFELLSPDHDGNRVYVRR